MSAIPSNTTSATDLAPALPSAGAASAARGRRAKVRILLALKVVISVGLLVFLLSLAGTQSAMSRLKDVAAWPFGLAIGTLVLNAFMAAARWCILSRLTGAPMGYWLAVKLTFAGLFFGQVLPGVIGGDAMRGWFGWRAGLPLFGFASGIVLDRIVSLIASIVMVCAGTPLLMRVAPASMTWLPPAFGCALVLGLAVLLALDRLPLPAVVRRPPIDRVLSALRMARAALCSRATLPAYALALVLQLSNVWSIYCLAWSLDLPISPIECFAVIPAIIFITMLPISFNGWGVREGAMAVGLGLFGVDSSDAILVSILFGVGILIVSLPGAILWLTISRTTPSAKL